MAVRRYFEFWGIFFELIDILNMFRMLGCWLGMVGWEKWVGFSRLFKIFTYRTGEQVIVEFWGDLSGIMVLLVRLSI